MFPPLFMTALNPLSSIATHSIMFSPKPKNRILFLMNLKDMLSKAFLKSISRSNPCLLFLLAHDSVSIVVRIHSPIYLPFTNPDWSELIMSGRTSLILFAIILLSNLYRTSRRVTGLQFVIRVLSLSPFGSSVIIPLERNSGNFLFLLILIRSRKFYRMRKKIQLSLGMTLI